MCVVYPLPKVYMWSIFYIWYVCGLFLVCLISTTGPFTKVKNNYMRSLRGRREFYNQCEVTACQPGPQRMANDLQVLKSILTGPSMSKLYSWSRRKKKKTRCEELSCLDSGKLSGTKPKGKTNVWTNPGAQAR